MDTVIDRSIYMQQEPWVGMCHGKPLSGSGWGYIWGSGEVDTNPLVLNPSSV